MSEQTKRDEFHEQVTKPIARALQHYLMSYPHNSDGSLGLRVALAGALFHEDQLAGRLGQEDSALRELSRALSR